MAKGFRFSLQAVLDHRKILEEERQREFNEILSQINAINQRQDEARASIEKAVAELYQKQREGTAHKTRYLYDNWINLLEELIKDLEEKKIPLLEELERRRLKLVKAVQDRTVMDKLRERELKDYETAEARAEMKFFDELSVRRFIDQTRMASAHMASHSTSGENHDSSADSFMDIESAAAAIEMSSHLD